MKVKFNLAKSVGGKAYKKNLVTVLPDKLAHTQEFKSLVKSGAISLLAKNAAEQAIQKGKDAQAAAKAQAAVHFKHPEAGAAHQAAKDAFAQKQLAAAQKG